MDEVKRDRVENYVALTFYECISGVTKGIENEDYKESFFVDVNNFLLDIVGNSMKDTLFLKGLLETDGEHRVDLNYALKYKDKTLFQIIREISL